MTRTDDHESYLELAVGYALDALEPDDEETFRRHLADCARCAGTLADLRGLTAHLAYAVDPAEPPPALGEAIAAAVRADGPRDQPEADQTIELDGMHLRRVRHRESTDAEPPARAPRRRFPIGEPAHARAGGRAVAVAAAVVLLVAGLGGWLGVVRVQGAGDRARADAAEAVLADLGAGARLVPLAATSAAAGASGFVAVAPNRLDVVVTGLPTPGGSATYVLWTTRPGAGLRPVAPLHDDQRVTLVDLARSTAPVDATSTFAISREPGRAVPERPTTVVLSALG